MYDGAVSAHAAYEKARGLVAELEKASGADVEKFKAEVESLAPAPQRGGRRGGFRRGGPSRVTTLNGASTALINAAMAMQGADVTPTAREVATCAAARKDAQGAMVRWEKLSTTGLAALNAKLKAAGEDAVTVPKM